jgi:hypothetical protein
VPLHAKDNGPIGERCAECANDHNGQNQLVVCLPQELNAIAVLRPRIIAYHATQGRQYHDIERVEGRIGSVRIDVDGLRL